MPTFLLSNYGKHAVKKKGIPILLSQIKDFPMYLDEKDLEYLIDIFLDNAKKLEFKIKDDFSKPDEVPYTFSIEFAKAFEHMVSEFKFPIETEKDIKQLLKIRDKFFYMAQQWIFSLVQKMDILNSLNGKDRELYIEVYQKTTDFYLRKEFMELTEYVAKQSKEKDLIFSKKYYTIGLFFRPK